MPPDEDLKQVLGGRWAEPLHAKILKHEEIDGGEALHQVAALAGGVGLGEILGQIERAPDERVVARANRANGDGHRRVRFPDAGRSNQERAVMIANEARRGQVDESRPRDLRIEGPIEARQLLHLRDAGLFQPPREEAGGAPRELVLDEQIEKVQMREWGSGRLLETER